MSLHAYSVNGNAGILKPLGKIVKSLGLSSAPGIHTIVIQIEFHVIIPFLIGRTSSPHESGIQELLAYHTIPDGVGTEHISVTVLSVGQTLVHHIPFHHLAGIMLHHTIDMVLEDIKQLFLGPPLGIAAGIAVTYP